MSARVSEFQPTTAKKPRAVRLAYFVSHPIQYQAPLLRRIAQEPDIDLTAFFSSDLSVRGYVDKGFGVPVRWDIPLLDGYKYEFLPRLWDNETVGFCRPLNWGIFHRLRRRNFDIVWASGYAQLFTLNAIFAARALGIPVFLWSDSSLFDRVRSKGKLAAKQAFFSILKPAISAILAIGKASEQYWRHYFGSDFPIFALPYSVDNDFFRQRCAEAALSRERFRNELGLEPGRPVILFASKFLARKRCIDLLEAYIRAVPGSRR